MNDKEANTSTAIFNWKHSSSDLQLSNIEINIPSKISSVELAYKLVKDNGLPFYTKADLQQSLEDFIQRETTRRFDEYGDNILETRLKEDINSLTEGVAARYRNEYREYAQIPNTDEEEEFASLYHNLLHSPHQMEVLNFENVLSLDVKKLQKEMDDDFENMIQKQNRELCEASSNTEHFTEHLLTQLASVHVEERQAFETNWNNKLALQRSVQRKTLLEWLLNTAVEQPPKVPKADEAEEAAPSFLSESFTIHLGSQLKVMHNLRLTCVDILDLCRRRSPEESLQTSLSLYSSNLSAGVLLVDNRISCYKGIKREFATICKSRAELHFNDIESQLSEIRSEFRMAAPILQREVLSPNGRSPTEDDVSLQPGEVYVTKHSNLGQLHVMFHVVAGSDEDELANKELTSRHNVVLGIRNILRISHEMDIKTLAIPLFLTNRLHPHMTLAWCSKRAELIYKCVKGFMIEMASLVADDTRTVEFIVPSGIDDQTFHALSGMLQSIFRMSNPLVLK